MEDRYQEVLDRFITKATTLSQRFRHARTQLSGVLSAEETRLSAQLPAALTAKEVELIIRSIEAKVHPGVQRLLGPFRRQLDQMEAMSRHWDARRRGVRDQMRLRSEQLQRLGAELSAHGVPHGIVGERLQSANERLQSLERELQRIERVMREAERVIVGYRLEFEAFETEVRTGIDHAVALVRQRGPIAHA